jgi:hypothetical protein
MRITSVHSLHLIIMKKPEEDKRAKFLKIYENIPEGLREDIVVVIDKKPYTWNISFIEIEGNTLLGRKILKVLENMGLI